MDQPDMLIAKIPVPPLPRVKTTELQETKKVGDNPPLLSSHHMKWVVAHRCLHVRMVETCLRSPKRTTRACEGVGPLRIGSRRALIQRVILPFRDLIRREVTAVSEARP